MKNPTTGWTKPVDDDDPNENLDNTSYGVIVSYFAIFIRWVFKKESFSILNSNYLLIIGKAHKLGNKLLRQKL